MDFRGPMNSTNIDITLNPPTLQEDPSHIPLLSCCFPVVTCKQQGREVAVREWTLRSSPHFLKVWKNHCLATKLENEESDHWQLFASLQTQLWHTSQSHYLLSPLRNLLPVHVKMYLGVPLGYFLVLAAWRDQKGHVLIWPPRQLRHHGQAVKWINGSWDSGAESCPARGPWVR